MWPHEYRGNARAALYARTLAGDPDNSLEVQVEALQEFARRGAGWKRSGSISRPQAPGAGSTI